MGDGEAVHGVAKTTVSRRHCVAILRGDVAARGGRHTRLQRGDGQEYPLQEPRANEAEHRCFEGGGNMKECEKFENGIRSLIAGDPELEQLEELVDHCKTCADCRELFEMHRTLAHLGSRFDALEPVDLARTRMLIVERVTANRRPRSAPGWMAPLMVPFRLRPLTAVALLAIVFVLGLAVPRIGKDSVPSARNLADGVFPNAGPIDLKNSPYNYSNVTVRLIDGNKVALAFDITKRVELVEPAQSEIVKKMLMHALFNPAPTGAVGHFQTGSPKGNLVY